MEVIPKIGILVGIVAVCIFLPLWVAVTIAENEYLFAKVFFDKDLHIEKMKQTESYKTMIERYPDSIVSTRSHAMHGSSIEMMAYNDNSDNELRVDIHFDQMSDYLFENARCNVMDHGDRKNLGTIPPEILDDSPIPKVMFSNGEAREGFTADFITYTNCIESKTIQDELEELDADHHIAIPENTGVPGCEEDLSCFEPYSLKIQVGDVVSFRNFDGDFHTVTSGSPESGPNGEFDSSLMEPGDQFLHKFTESDEYDYFCMVHPWQTGKIIVHEK
ncbi:MAG: hypothetical protein OEL77_02995 [Nitrosopumilus sp.]|nr:hypothetical protein [Nitrosopumilus sp.]MDH3384962.1 hypothetical protein [Nitrosopumilus sp.]